MPSGPVWAVTSRWPSRFPATVSASSRLWTNLDPALAGDVGDRSLAAAAGMDLRFEHGHPSAQAGKGVGGGLGRVGDQSARHGHARLAEDLLRLVFVDFHGAYSLRVQVFSRSSF